jgi:propanol-preferring alcohol dehydrogenase
MKAMLITHIASLSQDPAPLELADIPEPRPAAGEVLIKVSVCGVCHTELDEIEGRTPPARLPMVPGHQVIGRVVENGPQTSRFSTGERVGVAWIYSADQTCKFCLRGEENLCPEFRATGRDANGGYAQYMIVPEDFAYPIPDVFSNSEAAPLLCAGAVGYRALKLTNLQDGGRLGLAGFGASGHLVLKTVRQKYPHARIYAFSRSQGEREFALELGAVWAGDFGQTPPDRLDAIIDTTPVWNPIVKALEYLEPGGRLVINAIRKEEVDKEALLKLDYPAHLWLEKEIKSVANVTRQDVSEFLALAAQIPLRAEVEEYALEDANHALVEMKERKIRGAKVLLID